MTPKAENKLELHARRMGKTTLMKEYNRGYQAALQSDVVKELVEALKFYGNRNNWKWTCIDEISDHHDEICGDPDLIAERCRYYAGEKARQALSSFKKALEVKGEK